jgi:phage protein U
MTGPVPVRRLPTAWQAVQYAGMTAGRATMPGALVPTKCAQASSLSRRVSRAAAPVVVGSPTVESLVP